LSACAICELTPLRMAACAFIALDCED
jgi:hypothetical protein